MACIDFYLSFISLSILASITTSIPIDNGVEGEPEIECASSAITVNFNTKNIFDGHVYVLGRYNEAGCRNDEKGQRVAGIKLPFDKCGTQRQRSLNPKGIYVTTTVVITFHPQFLTKVDRAYRVQCFYMEADKSVSQELAVSEITTVFQTQTVAMPVCTYQIFEGGPTGQPVKYANIGQQVYHKWNCVTETTDIFCAVVHSCFVDDGAGNKVQLLDQNGCALDRYLLQNLEYTSDLMAGQEAHVFKYADKPALFFQCQISISIKEPNQQCSRPQCSLPGGSGIVPTTPTYPVGAARLADPAPVVRGPTININKTSPIIHQSSSTQPPSTTTNLSTTAFRKRNFDFPFRLRRFKRVANLDQEDHEEEIGVWDVQSQMITALDVGEHTDNLGEKRAVFGQSRNAPNVVCLSHFSFFTMFCFAVSSPITIATLISFLWLRKCRKNAKM